MDLVSCLPLLKRIQVSSVLNKDVTQYGKHHLTDGDAHTCWNSDQGLPQFVVLTMNEPMYIHSISITFQGGFAGTRLQMWIQTAERESFELDKEFDAIDTSSSQEFSIAARAVERVKIVFTKSSDLFGRITVYKLDLFSTKPVSGS
uniref:F5/8 type C domain-containing protein n=1 Tax=Spongospora subterranea TaxID=70186 RepID=A0A0H5RAJ4_9EUKA|eukprot:CRZ11093.1 hypothetical protein [Spongospora subterranea]